MLVFHLNLYRSLTDLVQIDDISIFNVYTCSYFNVSSSMTNPTCPQFSDGVASVFATNDSLYSDTFLIYGQMGKQMIQL